MVVRQEADKPEQQVRREQRLVFGEDAELYERARPTYPTALVDEVLSLAGARPTVLDVGCGTGKAAVLLASRGAAGVGVEADTEMAAIARRNLAGFPSWRVDVSDFEKWAPTERGPDAFDLVCSAQAWHWLVPTVRLHKAHELLRPGGWVALWWNRPDGGTPQSLREEIDRIYAEVAPEIRSKSSMGLPREEAAYEDVPDDLSFGAPLRRCYTWEKAYSAHDWVALLHTQSDHRLLTPGRLEELTTRVNDAIEAAGGVYTHRYACLLWSAQKL